MSSRGPVSGKPASSSGMSSPRNTLRSQLSGGIKPLTKPYIPVGSTASTISSATAGKSGSVPILLPTKSSAPCFMTSFDSLFPVWRIIFWRALFLIRLKANSPATFQMAVFIAVFAATLAAALPATLTADLNAPATPALRKKVKTSTSERTYGYAQASVPASYLVAQYTGSRVRWVPLAPSVSKSTTFLSS